MIGDASPPTSPGSAHAEGRMLHTIAEMGTGEGRGEIVIPAAANCCRWRTAAAARPRRALHDPHPQRPQRGGRRCPTWATKTEHGGLLRHPWWRSAGQGLLLNIADRDDGRPRACRLSTHSIHSATIRATSTTSSSTRSRPPADSTNFLKARERGCSRNITVTGRLRGQHRHRAWASPRASTAAAASSAGNASKSSPPSCCGATTMPSRCCGAALRLLRLAERRVTRLVELPDGTGVVAVKLCSLTHHGS